MRSPNHFLFVCTAVSSLVVVDVAARAAPIANTVPIAGGELAATDVEGVVVGGKTYDVTLVQNGSATVAPDVTFLGNSTGATSAMNQITAALQSVNALEFQYTNAGGMVLTNNNFVIADALCSGCIQGPYVGVEGSRTSNDPSDWSTATGIGIVPNDVFALFSVTPPTATVSTTPSGLDTEYVYVFTGLAGSGNFYSDPRSVGHCA